MKKETDGVCGQTANSGFSGFKSSSSHLSKAKGKTEGSYELPLKTFQLDSSKSSFANVAAATNKFVNTKVKPGSVRNHRANARRNNSSQSKGKDEFTFKPQTNDLLKSPFLAPVVNNLGGSIHRTMQMPKFIDGHFKQRLLM
jgi:hypothetical protein